MSDLDLERAKRTLRAYGIPFGGALAPCGHGCAGADRIVSGPKAHAGDLWMLEACGRCLLGRATRHEPGLPIPVPLVCPPELWLRRGHVGHRFYVPATNPDQLHSACGHLLSWPDDPVWVIRHAFDQGRVWRCLSCAGMRAHRDEVLISQPAVWRGLLQRAQAELDAAGHPVPWDRV